MPESDIFLLIGVSIIFLVEVYSETHLQNYGTLIERSIFLLSVKNLFIIVKFATLIGLIYVFFLSDISFLSGNFLTDGFLNIEYSKIYYYFIPSIIFTLFVFIFNSRELFYQLRVSNFLNKKLNYFFAFLQYVIFRLISFCLTYIIFISVFKGILKLNNYLTERGLTLFDWLSIFPSNEDNYNKGVYFSLVLTILIFLLFNNSFIKKNKSEFWNNRNIKFIFFKYLFVSLILSVGLFFGFFSILNGVYNLRNFGASAWLNEENILGIFPIRIASILITFYLLRYIYNEVLHKKPWHFLMLAILPLRSINDFNENVSFQKTETLFFSQISFYILNIALAEFFIILSYKDIYLSILNFAILFIIDDFKIINDYSNGFRRVLKSHFRRIWIFNGILFIASIIILISNNYYYILFIYIVFTIILVRYYFKNFSSVYIKNEPHSLI